LQIDIEAPSLRPDEAEPLLRLTQHALDDSNDFPAHHLRLRLKNVTHGSDGWKGNIDTALTVRVESTREEPEPRVSIRPNSMVLGIGHPASSNPSVLANFIAGRLQSMFEEERNSIRQLLLSSSSGTTTKSTNQVISTTEAKRSTRTAKYAPTYHLTFSLFTPGAFPSAWDIESTLEHTLKPLLASFSSISNFTIDTQVQPYATFSPSVRPAYSDVQNAWIIPREELGGFINAAEWPLNPGIGAGPTLNFVLYVAAPDQSPLRIEDSTTNSWIIPQWGGVMIMNPTSDKSLSETDLQPAVEMFASQLLSLLGLPTEPAISLPLRLSTLTRVRAANLLLSASSTLGSLARLVAALPSISVPDSVAAAVSSTMSHLDATCANLHDGQFTQALQNAKTAEQQAQKAFFERSMVGQVYFPDEHKVAVYLPLLGPMAVPLVMSALKEIKPILRSRMRSH